MADQAYKDRKLFGHVRAHDCDFVRSMLALGANPNARDVLGNTPLHVAAFNLGAEVCAILLEGGADVNAGGPDGNTPLHSVFRDWKYNGEDSFEGEGELYPPLIRLLISWGADPDAANDLGITARSLASDDLLPLMQALPAVPPGIPGWVRKMLAKRHPVPRL